MAAISKTSYLIINPTQITNTQNPIIKNVLKIVLLIFNNIVLVFSNCYERNYYNLTGYLFSEKNASAEEIFIHSFYALVANNPSNLEEIKLKVEKLKKFYPKNFFCVLSQALIIASKHKAPLTLKNFLQNELYSIENYEIIQNSHFIPSDDTHFIHPTDASQCSTHWKVGVISAGLIIIGSASLYYGYSTGILNNLLTCFIRERPSLFVQPALSITQKAVFTTFSALSSTSNLSFCSNLSICEFQKSISLYKNIESQAYQPFFNRSITSSISEIIKDDVCNISGSMRNTILTTTLISTCAISLIAITAISALAKFFSSRSFLPIARSLGTTSETSSKTHPQPMTPSSTKRDGSSFRPCLGFKISIYRANFKNEPHKVIDGLEETKESLNSQQIETLLPIISEMETTLVDSLIISQLNSGNIVGFIKRCRNLSLTKSQNRSNIVSASIPKTPTSNSQKRQLRIPTAPKKKASFRLPSETKITINTPLTETDTLLKNLEEYYDLTDKQVIHLQNFLHGLENSLLRVLEETLIKTEETQKYILKCRTLLAFLKKFQKK